MTAGRAPGADALASTPGYYVFGFLMILKPKFEQYPQSLNPACVKRGLGRPLDHKDLLVKVGMRLLSDIVWDTKTNKLPFEQLGEVPRLLRSHSHTKRPKHEHRASVKNPEFCPQITTHATQHPSC